MIGIDIALFVCRAILDLGALFSWGAAAFVCTLMPSGLRVPGWRRLMPVRRAALAGVLLAVCCALPLHAASLGAGWSDAFNPALLYSVAFGTTIGTAWCVQACASLLFLGLPLAGYQRGALAWALYSVALLASLPLSGHAMLHDGATRTLHQVNQLLHLLSGGAWAGSLVVVLSLLPGLRRYDEAEAVKLALRRFSSAGHVVVVLVLVSGVVSGWLIVGSWPGMHSAYQQLLLFKIALVTLMVMIALANRYLLLPRMRFSAWAAPLFNWLMMAEIALAGIVVVLVAWFGMLEPS